MYRRVVVALTLLASVCISLTITERAEAFRRWRLRRTYRAYSGHYRVAPKRDADSTTYTRLPVYYSYRHARGEDVAFRDRVRVFLRVHDDRIQESADALVAKVKVASAADLTNPRVFHVPVSLSRVEDESYSLGEFDISNEGLDEDFIEPATVYRMFVSLQRHVDDSESDDNSVWGRVPGPYYVATSGDTPIDKARQQVVMRTFSEWYCTKRGWRREGGYRMDCHDYYRWALGEVTVGASYNRANLARIYGGDYRNGGNIKGIAESDSIHGDYVRIPGHTFMLLGYDPERHEVLTMEGNFNNSIEVAVRSVGSGWTVGHLTADDIKPELFADDSTPDDMTAGMSEGQMPAGG